MYRSCIVLLTIFVTVNTESAVLQEKYPYEYYTPVIDQHLPDDLDALQIRIERLIVNTKNMKIEGVGISADYSGCPENPELFCIRSGIIDLAIPRRLNLWPKAWKSDFAWFKQIETREIDFFGTTYEVVIISSKLLSEDSFIHTYFYSLRDGLIAFTKYDVETKRFTNYFLSGHSGLRLDVLSEQFEVDHENEP